MTFRGDAPFKRFLINVHKVFLVNLSIHKVLLKVELCNLASHNVYIAVESKLFPFIVQDILAKANFSRVQVADMMLTLI
jgi:hypothetical protein